MSGLPITQELQQLVSKYADMSTPVDFLRALSQAAKLEEANILFHERMARTSLSLAHDDVVALKAGLVGQVEVGASDRLVSAMRSWSRRLASA
eukprot:gene24566-27783_t